MVSMAAAPAAVSTVVPATKQYGELTAPEIAPVIVPVIKPVAAPSKAACPAPFQLPVVIRCVTAPDSAPLTAPMAPCVTDPTNAPCTHDFLMRPAALQQQASVDIDTLIWTIIYSARTRFRKCLTQKRLGFSVLLLKCPNVGSVNSIASCHNKETNGECVPCSTAKYTPPQTSRNSLTQIGSENTRMSAAVRFQTHLKAGVCLVGDVLSPV